METRPISPPEGRPMPPPAPPTRPPIGTFVLLIIAGFFYLGMAGSLSGLNETDAAGRGMAIGFGGIFGAALWLMLAVVLLVAAIKGQMPAFGKIGALLLLPASAGAACAAVDLYSQKAVWAFAVVLVLPMPIAAYALWARLPSLRAALPPGPTSAVVGGAIVLLSLAPFVASNFALAATPSPQETALLKAREEAFHQEEQEGLKREAEQFAKLGPDSSLRDYLPYLPGGDSRSHEAIEGAGKVKSRQADAVALLNDGRLDGLTYLFRLDLQPTPELCQAYGNALASASSRVTKARSDYLSVAIDLEQQLPNIKWLVDGGCNLNDALDLLADHLRGVADSDRMETFAARLVEMKR